jgi:hypothetical protein
MLRGDMRRLIASAAQAVKAERIGPRPVMRYNKPMRYEHKTEPLLPFRQFVARMMAHVSVGLLVIAGSLGVGVLGYHHFERLPWLDALLNASMILGGMGPVDPVRTPAGKAFASGYALFSGVIFLAVVGIMMAPAAHRLLHRLHLERAEMAGTRGSVKDSAS